MVKKTETRMYMSVMVKGEALRLQGRMMHCHVAAVVLREDSLTVRPDRSAQNEGGR